jgi:methylated-DNA-[protein]-cysteine S-methyltransferase
MLIVTAFNTAVGWLQIEYDEHDIYHANFTGSPSSSKTVNQLTNTIAIEIDYYFCNPHHRFQLPLKPQGTPYQQRVWNALLAIPVGRTLSYGELAKTLQSSPRAIGQACKSNPLALFIPCHRVVGKNSCGGYMGQTTALHYKTGLLRFEEARVYTRISSKC